MSTRYQREIEDILEQSSNHAMDQLEDDSARDDSARDDSLPAQNQLLVSVRSFFLSLKPGRLMLISVSLLLISLLLGGFNLSFSGLVAWVAGGLFIIAYVLYFIRPSGSNSKRRWRGRPIDYK